MPEKAITHKREPSSLALKQRISSISSETLAKKEQSSPPVEKPPEDNAKTRRKALKDFYKLQEEQRQQLDKLKIGDGIANIEGEQKVEDMVLTPENFDEYISRVDFIRILKDEDEILEELGNNQSEIKSIIYNNYYELIKINDILMHLKERNEHALKESANKSVEENLQNVKESLASLRGIDVDVFGEEEVVKEEDGVMNSKREVEEMCKAVNRLVLSKMTTKQQLEKIEEVLPEIKVESLILQLNEIKEKGFRE